MDIKEFEKLLQNAKGNPSIRAYVPHELAGQKRVTAVNVVYKPNGTVYTYKGSIISVAQRLGIVPKITASEAQKRAKALLDAMLNGAVVYDELAEISDELAVMVNKILYAGEIDWHVGVDYSVKVKPDEYGRKRVRFYKSVDFSWFSVLPDHIQR